MDIVLLEKEIADLQKTLTEKRRVAANARYKVRSQSPEVKARLRAYSQRPEVKAKRAAAHKRWLQIPENKAKFGAYSAAYQRRPDVIALKAARRAAKRQTQPDIASQPIV